MSKPAPPWPVPMTDLRAHELGIPCSPRFIVEDAYCTECGWRGTIHVRKGHRLFNVKCPGCSNDMSLLKRNEWN